MLNFSVLCGDFMFVIVFPQLTLVLYWELANTYGSVASFIVGLILRLLCGDKSLGIPPAISFGTMYGEEGSCPTDEDPLAACTGPVPFRLIVTIIGTVSRPNVLEKSINPVLCSLSTLPSAMDPTLFSTRSGCPSTMTSSSASRENKTERWDIKKISSF